MWVRTLPVFTKLATPGDIPEVVRGKLPPTWDLYAHQAETYRAITEGDADVVVNVAMTGDGKSLASQLPCLVNSNWPVLAMYPTNELIADQFRQAVKARDIWQRQALGVTKLNAGRLDELQEQTTLQRRDLLLMELQNNELVLTNPDIFHYVMQQYYIRTGKHGENPDHVIGRLVNMFEQFTFDEFHVFQTPEAVAITNALVFINEITGESHRKRFLFLSATPQDRLAGYLVKGGMKVTRVHGSYAHGTRPPQEQGWRLILHGLDLHFADQRAEEWVAAHLDDTVLRFFLDYRPAAKGAIIVNSVAAALRLTQALRPVFEQHGLSVMSNTGFDDRESRRASYDADMLVATSTVDVGVDFQINFLVFESRDTGSFLQRLGRLGRHGGFERDGREHKFQAFEAHALVPAWVQERLFHAEAGAPPVLTEGMELDRESLSRAVEAAFPPFATFERYRSIWGGLQAAYMVNGLAHPVIRANYEESRKRLITTYGHVLGVSIPSERARLHGMMRNEPQIVEEVRSFRGGGDLICGVIDETRAGPARVKKYGLFDLLTNFDLDDLGEEEFLHEIKRWELPGSSFAPDRLAGYFRVLGVGLERRGVTVYFNRDVGEWGVDRYSSVQVVDHIEVKTEGRPYLSQLNVGLRKRKLVALFSLLPTLDLSRKLHLPSPFPLYQFVSRDNIQGSIAFGRQALLLQVALIGNPSVRSEAEEKPLIF